MQPAVGPILITGAAGFVGAGAAHALVQRGAEVHVLVRSGTPSWRLVSIWDRLQFHVADLTDARRVSEVVSQVKPAIVLHFATFGAYEHQADARQIFQTALVGTYNLTEALLRQRPRLLVNIGSSSEYGLCAESMQEADRLQPNSYYALTKAAQTHLCQYLARREGLAMPTFRLFSVYGPWEEPTRLVPTLLRRCLADLPLEVVDPRIARDFIYLDDVLDLLLDFERLQRAAPDGVYNLGTGIQTNLGELVPVLLEVTGCSAEVRWGAMAARHWDSFTWCADPRQTQETFGWEARHSLRDGLRQTLAWLKRRGDWHAPQGGRLVA